MRKCFIDLLVTPSNADIAAEIVKVASKLGYCMLGVEAQEPVFAEAKKAADKLGLKVIRVYQAPGARRSEVARALESAPKGPVLRLATPRAADAARYAGANKKLAGFVLNPGLERLVDRSTRRLFMERGWGIVVIPLVHLLRSRDSIKTWRFYYVSLRRGYAYGVDLALASGASKPSELWHPYSAAGLGELVGVPWEAALTWITSAPARVVEKFVYRG